MPKVNRTVLRGVVLMFLIYVATPVVAEPAALDVGALLPSPLVSVVELSAIGPDGERHSLLRAASGTVVSLDDVGVLTTLLTVASLPMSGAYHGLLMKIEPALYLVDDTGRRVRVATRGPVPSLVPLDGAIVLVDGRILAPGVAVRPANKALPCSGAAGRYDDD